MKYIIYIFIIMATSLSYSFQAHCTYINVPRDNNGWHAFTPSLDTRIMYVSADGNDDAAALNNSGVYTIGNHPDWSNPFKPTGNIQPFASVSAAFAYARTGYPDWILIKRGDSFFGGLFNKYTSGRSSSEPFLIAAYGEDGPPPIFKVDNTQNAISATGAKQWVAFSGLSFYAYKADPDSLDYESLEQLYGFNFYAEGSNWISNILVEGCNFSHFQSSRIQGPSVKNIHVYRCVFTDSNHSSAHAQGIGGGNFNNVTIEESFFDHNGWAADGSHATIFRHNLYLGPVDNLVVKNNTFSRPSSMNNKFTCDVAGDTCDNIQLVNNLYLDGNIAISMGGNTTGPLRFKEPVISGNVISNLNESHAVNDNQAWAVGIQDWDGGTFSKNIIMNTFGQTNGYVITHLGVSRNVSIVDNVFYNLPGTPVFLVIDGSRGSDVSGMVVEDNIFQSNSAIKIVGAEYNPSGLWLFSDNKYSTTAISGARFSIESSVVSDENWAETTVDSSAFETVSFPDPTRSVETYMASLGETATIDAFVAKGRAQDRYNWDTRFTAEATNAWIKAGFGTGQRRLFRNVRIGEVEP